MNRAVCVIVAVLAMAGLLALGPTADGRYLGLALVLIVAVVRLVHLTERLAK